MAEYASNGKGNLATTLGAIGLGFGVLNGGLGNIGGILGNNQHACGENAPVNRYEAQMQAQISALANELKLRDANTFTMGEMNSLRTYVDGRIERIEHELCDQRVYNTANTAAVSCIQGQVAQLMSLTKFAIPQTSICPPITTTTTAGA